MGFLHGTYRHEESLDPERLDASSTEDHPVRFLEALVDELDRAACGCPRALPAATGRPGSAPGDLRRVWTLIAMPRRLAALG